jgi:hypothetical protein
MPDRRADVKHRGEIAGLPRGRDCTFGGGQDLHSLGKERGAGHRAAARGCVLRSGGSHLVPLQALDLLAECGLNGVLASCRPPKWGTGDLGSGARWYAASA